MAEQRDGRCRPSANVEIQQVLVNLLKNGIDALQSCQKRELVIATRTVGEMIEFRVSDTRPGFPDGLLERLLDPFVTTKEDEIGVGLSICRIVVEGHGGQLRAGRKPTRRRHLLLHTSGWKKADGDDAG